MLRTVEIEKELNITRQSLHNYIKQGDIEKPFRDRKGYLWSNEDIQQIKKVIKSKYDNQRHTLSQEKKLEIQNRRYLGSKQKMLPFINEVVEKHTKNVNIIADIFGGTGVVADLFNRQEKQIIVNDILFSNFVSYVTWFGNDNVDLSKVEYEIDRLNNLKGIRGYVTDVFGDRYFSIKNAQKIDAIREEIDCLTNLNGRERSCIMTSLLYAMDKVANTVGHFDAYRKKMDSTQELILRVPNIKINSGNKLFNMDANELVKHIKADLVYIDTPYNSRGYENAYHVLENVAEWKKPKVEGVARKAVNRSEKSSDYTKSKAPIAFNNLISNINSKYILVSYNNMEKKGNSRSNAKISGEEIMAILNKKGKVSKFETDFAPFTTGKSHIKNHKEILYLCEVN